MQSTSKAARTTYLEDLVGGSWLKLIIISDGDVATQMIDAGQPLPSMITVAILSRLGFVYDIAGSHCLDLACSLTWTIGRSIEQPCKMSTTTETATMSWIQPRSTR